MSLSELIATAPLQEIAATLDGMGDEERVAATRELGKSSQVALWEKAASAEALTLDFFVPQDRGRVQEVIHEGRNTLPAFKVFQKRFCRPADAEDRLFGYNEGATRGLIGPGFFLAVDSPDPPAGAEGCAIVIDYFRVPQGPVPDAWPAVVPNEQGLQRWVYAKTRDYMRRVSAHVSIGRAFKNGTKPMPAWFVLCRRDS
ncbi:MAG: hypothetical protein EA398_05165 [Deltaproteobacteria bacterium]|nr:MAG: hypothetical protein EA398_05165 [Deltaproteobacteria bacterium]